MISFTQGLIWGFCGSTITYIVYNLLIILYKILYQKKYMKENGYFLEIKYDGKVFHSFEEYNKYIEDKN